MTKSNYSHILLILDQSGSMNTLRNEVNQGITNFLEKQRLEPGECTVSVYHFSDPENVKCVVNFANIHDLNTELAHIRPGGMTALLDGIKYAFVNTGNTLESMKEEDRPSRVLVTVFTDGQENSSRRASHEEVRAMIQHQRNVYSWQIDFLGCNEGCFSDANTIGIQPGAQLVYNCSAAGIADAFNKMSASKSMLRNCTMDSYVSAVSNGEIYSNSNQGN